MRLADLADLSTGLLATSLETMASRRGYPQKSTQGASFVVLSAEAVAPTIYRATRGAPLPSLHPDRTWWQLTPQATVKAIRVDEQQFVAAEITSVTLALHEQLDGLYEAIRVATRVSLRSQWALLMSSIAGMLKILHPDDHLSADRVLQRICSADGMFDAVRPHVHWLDVGGRQVAVYTRRVCCFNYRGNSGEYCSNCPLVPLPERIPSVSPH